MRIMKSGLGLLRRRDMRDFASSSGCQQMVTEPTHNDRGVLELVLTDIPDGVEIRVGSTLGTSDHSAIFMNVVLEQAIPHLGGRQAGYLKNYVDWTLVGGDVKSLNWNGIIRFLCPLSSLSEVLLQALLTNVPNPR